MVRVAANSYGDGKKYVGGNTFIHADGSIEKVYGYFTSPSGKATYTYEDDSIIVLESGNVREVGTVYKDDKILYKPSKIMTHAQIVEQAEKLANGKPIEGFFIEAAKILGGE